MQSYTPLSKRSRLLIVGCGDVGQRVLPLVLPKMRVYALSSSPESCAALRQLGVVPLLGNLDAPHTVRRLAGLAQRVLHLAPPNQQIPAVQQADKNNSCSGRFDGLNALKDHRTIALSRVLRRSQHAPVQVVYGSTSGVYGDCAGALIDETRAVAPETDRAKRRVSAERSLRQSGLAVSILRIPGIYAPDRANGTPAARLQKGTPVLQAAEDVYTNHIHADDLARACYLALWRGRPQRVYHASDDCAWKMGDYFDIAADMLGLPRPPRLPRAEMVQVMGTMPMSFLRESRRLDNARLHSELGLRLRYPTPREGLAACAVRV